MRKPSGLIGLSGVVLLAWVWLAVPAAAIQLYGVSTGVGPGSFGGLGVSFDGSGSDELLAIDPATGVATTVGIVLPSGMHNFNSALDTAGGRYFYVTDTGLHVVDSASGALIATHPLAVNLLGLELDPASGLLYGLDVGLGSGTFGNSNLTLTGSGSNDLVSIDPGTGTVSVVGTGLPSGALNFGGAVDPGAGTYVYTTDGALHVVDLATGTLVFSHALAENLHGLELDPLSGLLFGVAFGVGPATFGNSEMSFAGDGANDFVTVDPVTGVATVLATGLPSGEQNFAAAIDPAAGQYFYRTGDTLVTVDLATGALMTAVPAPENFLALEAPFAPAPPVVEVVIDIKPGSDPNSVNPRSRGVIPVAVLTTSVADGDPLDFDAAAVDTTTLAFGPAGAAVAHPGGHLEDADGDGDLDLVVHFRTQETGIACGDTEATLTGATFGGQAIVGVDAVRTVGCG